VLIGDTAIISAPEDWAASYGSAAVFQRGAGGWIETQLLLASDGAGGDFFGTSMDTDGTTLVIGAPEAGATNGGAVYLFQVVAGSWQQIAKLEPSTLTTQGQFGCSVSIDGSTLVVGARQSSGTGEVYVFTGSGATWMEQAKLVASDGASQDDFGVSVDLRGDTLAIGAQGDDDTSVSSGSVYVFTRSGTTWSEAAKLHAGDATQGDRFGYRVELDGTSLAVSAVHGGDSGSFECGWAYVFTGAGSAWVQEAKLAASIGYQSQLFGSALVLNGDRLVVGASSDMSHAVGNGAIFVFDRVGTTWTETGRIFSDDLTFALNFGASIDCDGTRMLVGAIGQNIGGNWAGGGYVMELAPVLESYCTAKTNSQGCVPTISTIGAPSASAASGFDIIGSNFLNKKSGLMFYGTLGRFSLPFQGGHLCVKPPFKRTSVQSSGGSPTGLDCTGAYSLDFNAYLAGGGDPAVTAGKYVQAQYWSRDPADPFTVSLSAGIEFVVCP
jgi:hypothetical protein